MMTPNQLADALTNARPGDRVIYFTGHLSRTCEEISRDQRAAQAIQAYAMGLYEAGRALLVQMRMADGFLYMAVKTRAGA